MIDTNEATTVAAKPATRRQRKMAREPKTESSEQLAPGVAPAKPLSKVDLVVTLLHDRRALPSTSWSPRPAGYPTRPAPR